MKKFYLILLPLIVIICIAGSTLLSQGKLLKQNDNKEFLSGNNKKNNATQNADAHTDKSLNCKSCHESEYPTRNDPGLKNCPRKNMVSDFPSSKEGPDVVEINNMSENYNEVVFSHRIHSKMSEMTVGCTGCHHYNTTGPVLSCKECHEKSRIREDLSIPDLKAAYHRQCMSCHKQWSHENGCGSQCHSLKGFKNLNISGQELSGKTHPELSEPSKMKWETSYEQGKIVTFCHDEHTKLFKLNCKSCHGQDNCTKCHDANVKVSLGNQPRTQNSFEDRHKPCIKCHEGNTCQKCHTDKEMSPFNHGKTTGWTLKSFHSKLACTKCHGNSMPYKRLDNNCVSCHKNFTPGNFDHNKSGLMLSENHRDFECNNCHTNNDFSKAPQCKMCHDDKSFPAQLPGKRK